MKDCINWTQDKQV